MNKQIENMSQKCLSDHNWNGCKCECCGETKDEHHDWDGCKCKRCGEEQHDWEYEEYESSQGTEILWNGAEAEVVSCYETLRCRKCGKTEMKHGYVLR